MAGNWEVFEWDVANQNDLPVLRDIVLHLEGEERAIRN